MADASGATPEVARRLDQLARELKVALGEDLVSLVLYGSAARGDYVGGGSDLNMVVVVRDLALERLERATPVARGWEASGNRPLLFFSPEWIASSCDVFPIEFLDIIESHRAVLGPDPFEGLNVSSANLRLQCESELKTKLIHLRTGYVELQGEEESLAKLLAASYAPVVAVCRGLLRLQGERVPQHHHEVTHRIAERFGVLAAPFDDVAALKRSGPAAASAGVRMLFRNYYSQIEALARSVDAGIDKGAGR